MTNNCEQLQQLAVFILKSPVTKDSAIQPKNNIRIRARVGGNDKGVRQHIDITVYNYKP